MKTRSLLDASKYNVMVISVVIATYNGERFIKKQLESIYGQSVQPDEVIICDDGSTDTTADIVRGFIGEKQVKNWVLYENDVNKGFKLNFLQALKKATGDIVFLCDQDDIWHPEKIKLMKEVMEQDDKVSLLACSYTEFMDDVPKDSFVAGDGGAGLKRKVDLPVNLLTVPYPGCSYCVRRDFLHKCFSYWVDTCPHDAILWRYATLLGEAYTYDMSLFMWRKHTDSTWQTELALNDELHWRQMEEIDLKKMMEFVNGEVTRQKSQAYQAVTDNLGWVSLRKKFQLERHISDGLRLIKYLKFYSRKRDYLRDWKLLFS